MKKLRNILFLAPLIGLVYMYASQGIGVFLGSPEHYDILAALGWSRGFTNLLVSISVMVDLGVALLLIIAPNAPLFVFAALWTWIPRGITVIAPGPENEFFESLAVFVLAVLAYLSYRRGHVLFDLFRKKR